MTLVGVLVGGGLGALARYHLGGFIAKRRPSVLPTSTLTVNVAGSALLGALVGLLAVGGIDDTWLLWAGVGFAGGLTTFSTFAYETLQLLEQGANRIALLNVALSTVLCLGIAAVAYAALRAG